MSGINLSGLNSVKLKKTSTTNSNTDTTNSNTDTQKTQEEIKKEIDKILDDGQRTPEKDTELCRLMYQEQNPDLVIPPPPINAPMKPIKYVKLKMGRVSTGQGLLTTEEGQIMAVYKEHPEDDKYYYGASFKNAQIDKVAGLFLKEDVGETIKQDDAINQTKVAVAKKAVPFVAKTGNFDLASAINKQQPEPETNTNANANAAADPLAQFRKMIQTGVPAPAVALKMRNANMTQEDIDKVTNPPAKSGGGSSTRKRSQRKYKKNRRSNKKRKMTRGKGKGKRI
jgi:hypothetical protein